MTATARAHNRRVCEPLEGWKIVVENTLVDMLFEGRRQVEDKRSCLRVRGSLVRPGRGLVAADLQYEGLRGEGGTRRNSRRQHGPQ